MRRVLLFIAGCLVSLSSLADYTMGIHTVSYHDRDPYNSANNGNMGMYVRFDNCLTAGAYINSFKQDTVYLGCTSKEYYRVSFTTLVATGYLLPGAEPDKERNVILKAFGQSGLIPMVMPTIRLLSYDVNNGHFVSEAQRAGIFSVRLGYVPTWIFDPNSTNIYSLMLEGRFK